MAELISVIVPHRDDLAGLDTCLAALTGQTLSNSRFEIVVADNGSACGIEAVEALVAERARVVAVAQPGAGPARNGGVAVARGAILAFVDSDCIAEPGWLAAGVAALGEGEVVCGAMRVLVENSTRPSPAEAFELAFAFDNRAYVTRKGFGVTANLFARHRDFLRVGGFRTGVSEDQDWCIRARAAGLRLHYAPEAVVGHPARRDWPALRRKWQRIVAEQHALSCEQRFGRIRWLVRTWLIPLSIMPHGVKIAITPRLIGGRARLVALAGLVRLRLWRFAEAHRVMWRKA